MEIGDWPSVAGMAETYRKARDLGLETNLAELEAFGFTVVPPEKTGIDPAMSRALLERLKEMAAEEDAAAVALNKHADRPAAGRQLFHLLSRDPLFIEALMHPVTRTFAAYLLGQSVQLYSMVAFLKDGPAKPTLMHCDSVGVPTPLPFYSSVCNVSWILTDYTRENGTFAFVPGSHRWCRHPTEGEQPDFAGGLLKEGTYVPTDIRPGSLVVFSGNTWHCTMPKTSEGMRAHIATAFCRNYVFPAETYDDMPDEILGQHDPALARLIGRDAWQGYRSEGPQHERMLLVRPAYQSQYG